MFASPNKVSPEVRQALDELDRMAARRSPSPSEPILVLQDLIPLLFAEPPAVSIALENDVARQRLRHGTPLLRGLAPALNAEELRHCWHSICRLLERHRNDGNAARLATLLDRKDWQLEEVVGRVLAGDTAAIGARAEAAAFDSQLVLGVLRLTLYPLFSSIRAALATQRAGVGWPRGFCPTCGSWPLLAEYRGLEQTRFLRCGLCADGWEFPRLECPYCAQRDHRRLGFLSVEGQEARFRVSTCDACRGYTKTVSTLEALSEPMLLVMDLATLHLDLSAMERGFVPGGEQVPDRDSP